MGHTYKTPTIQLRNTIEWTEKANGYPDGTLRIYVGKLWVGNCIPSRKEPDKFSFSSNVSNIVTDRATLRSLEDIKDDIALSIKEFVNKVAFISQ